MLHFGLLMLAAVLTASLPWPWAVSSLAFVALALAAGIRALISLRRARVRGVLTPMLAVGLAFTALLGLTSAGAVMTWPAQTARQECLRDALTVSAKARCEQSFHEDVATFQQDLMDRASRG